jgi:drug/metabolite transporter (DMT)-like permease
MVAVAATLFAINGTVSKVILGSGIDAQQLTEVRCVGALLGLMLIALATRPAALPIQRSELPRIVALGVVGLALVQWSLSRPRAGRPAARRRGLADERAERRGAGGRGGGRGDLRGVHPARRARRVGITAMLEPVVAITVAWAWLGESLDPVQVSGAAVTLAGVALALSSR